MQVWFVFMVDQVGCEDVVLGVYYVVVVDGYWYGWCSWEDEMDGWVV